MNVVLYERKAVSAARSYLTSLLPWRQCPVGHEGLDVVAKFAFRLFWETNIVSDAALEPHEFDPPLCRS